MDFKIPKCSFLSFSTHSAYKESPLYQVLNYTITHQCPLSPRPSPSLPHLPRQVSSTHSSTSASAPPAHPHRPAPPKSSSSPGALTQADAVFPLTLNHSDQDHLGRHYYYVFVVFVCDGG